jgi:hypothetical protein
MFHLSVPDDESPPGALKYSQPAQPPASHHFHSELQPSGFQTGDAPLGDYGRVADHSLALLRFSRSKYQTRHNRPFEIGILQQGLYATLDRLNFNSCIFIPGFWASLQMISKREIGNPKWAAALYQSDVESGGAPSTKVDATWDSSLAHIIVAKVDERRPDCIDIVVGLRSHHDVDYWLCDQPGNCGAPDVLNPKIGRQAY